jgi:hypothetical protein
MSGDSANNQKARLEAIRLLLGKREQFEPVKTIGDYLKVIRDISERWQEEDWKATECDEDVLLNNVRIVGQIWFRGHAACDPSLRPGLYRESTRKHLLKQPGSPRPG